MNPEAATGLTPDFDKISYGGSPTPLISTARDPQNTKARWLTAPARLCLLQVQGKRFAVLAVYLTAAFIKKYGTTHN